MEEPLIHLRHSCPDHAERPDRLSEGSHVHPEKEEDIIFSLCRLLRFVASIPIPSGMRAIMMTSPPGFHKKLVVSQFLLGNLD